MNQELRGPDMRRTIRLGADGSSHIGNFMLFPGGFGDFVCYDYGLGDVVADSVSGD